MKNQMNFSPPLVIRVGAGHWKPPKSVILEVEWFDKAENYLQYRRFALLMDDIVIYEGSGYGIEQFGNFISSPNNPPEIQFIAELINTVH